jgi:hypothetical protein
MAVNRRNLESMGMWEFLLWVKDVEKVVLEDKVISFVDTYMLKNMIARVGLLTVNFCTRRLAEAFALPEGGLDPGNLPNLKKPEAEEIFYYNFRWDNETK